jgi:hypothetical protein
MGNIAEASKVSCQLIRDINTRAAANRNVISRKLLRLQLMNIRTPSTSGVARDMMSPVLARSKNTGGRDWRWEKIRLRRSYATRCPMPAMHR